MVRADDGAARFLLERGGAPDRANRAIIERDALHEPPHRPGAVTDAERLRREADIVHRVLFGTPAPEDLQHQYSAALQLAPLADWPRLDLADLDKQHVDLEALELAARRSNPRNALTQRFQVVCYLAEARPDTYATFVNERRRFVTGWLTLVLHAVRSVAKLIKGRRLLQVHAVR